MTTFTAGTHDAPKPQPKPKPATHTVAQDRIPPRNIDAEVGVLGSIIIEEEGGPLLEKFIAKGITAKSFFSAAHQLIFEAMLNLHARGIEVDETTLPEELHKLGELANVGGAAYINELTRRIEVTAHAAQWADIVVEKHRRRKLIDAAATTVEKAFQPGTDVDEIAESVRRSLAELAPAKGEVAQLPFPTDVFCGPAFSMTKAVAANVQVSETMPALCALGVLSSVLGKVCAYDPIRDKKVRANLFIIGVAESGCGKSETLRNFIGPLHDIEKRTREKWAAEAGSWKAELKGLEAKESGRIPKKDAGKAVFISGMHNGGNEARIDELNKRLTNGAPAIIGEDMTIEKMEAMLAANDGKLFVCTAEGHRLFQNMTGRNNNNNADDSGTWCKVWSGDPINTRRMSREVFVENPAVSLLALVQPDLAARFRGNLDFESRGLLARTLFADTEAKPAKIDIAKGVPKVPQDIRDRWSRFITAMHEECCIKTPKELAFSKPAAALLAGVHNDNVALFNDGKIDAFGIPSRRGEHAARLAVVLHAMKHGREMFRHEISSETAQGGILVELFFRQFQERLLEAKGAAGHKHAAKIAEALSKMREKREGLSLNQVRVICSLNSRKKAQELVSDMLSLGLVSATETERGTLYQAKLK